MNISSYKGTVKNGQITLSSDIKLPEMTEVFVIVPDNQPKFDLVKMAAEMPKNYLTQEDNFGQPEGREIW